MRPVLRPNLLQPAFGYASITTIRRVGALQPYTAAPTTTAAITAKRQRRALLPVPAAAADADKNAEDEEDDQVLEIDELEDDFPDAEGPSAPDYSDYIEFEEDPPGHRSGFVAIIGRPNAGKSTLLNAMLGQTLSIVTAKAQTTRHRVLGVWSEPGHQAVFLDTPGIIADRRNELEERMMGAVDAAVKDADALLAIIDASRRPEGALNMLRPGADWKGPPMAVILNKIDLMEPEKVEALAAQVRADCGPAVDAVLPISALTGQGTRAVADWVVSKLQKGLVCTLRTSLLMPRSASLLPR